MDDLIVVRGERFFHGHAQVMQFEADLRDLVREELAVAHRVLGQGHSRGHIRELFAPPSTAERELVVTATIVAGTDELGFWHAGSFDLHGQLVEVRLRDVVGHQASCDEVAGCGLAQHPSSGTSIGVDVQLPGRTGLDEFREHDVLFCRAPNAGKSSGER